MAEKVASTAEVATRLNPQLPSEGFAASASARQEFGTAQGRYTTQ